MSEFQLTSYGDDEGPLVKAFAPEVEEAEFKRLYVRYMTARADEIEHYAREAADNAWIEYARGDWPGETPEGLAQADIDAWDCDEE